MKKILILIASITLISCVKVPVIEKHPVILNDNKKADIGTNIETDTPQDINLNFRSDKWWTSLNDSNLDNIMDLVLTNNKTLEISRLNIKKAEEGINLAKAGRGLDVGFGGNTQEIYAHEKFTNLSQIGLQTSYDVDLFGKVKNLVKQQDTLLKQHIK